MPDYIFQHLIMVLILILGCVFLLTKFQVFRNTILKQNLSPWEQVSYAIFFGIIGILGTHAGFQTTYAIANTRAVAAITAGLIGGPWVGLGAGLIAGVDRYFLGGMSALTSSVSTVLEGILAGLYYSRFSHAHNRWAFALGLGLLLETMHMLILLFSPPFDHAVQLVKAISPSMLIINPIGIAMLIAIMDTIYEERDKLEGKAARLALQIAEKTLTFLRSGLNEKSAYDTAATIYQSVDSIDAVVITSLDNVLAFVGTGDDHHKILQTKSTLEVLTNGNYKLDRSKEEIGCMDPNCPLQSKIIVALTERGIVVGSLGFYKTKPDSITAFEIELIKGLSHLISVQLEASKVEQYSALRAAAEIKALQSQINPHFLFNALNTIVYYCRSQPETARNLLLNLADFYRNNLEKVGEWVDLETEMHHVDAYVQIETARFREKLQVIYEFPEPYHKKIPALILQPIVENAIKHGLYPKRSGGRVTISGRWDSAKRYVVSVTDDGVGIPASKLAILLQGEQANTESRTSIGLVNVHQRLQAIYGSEYGLIITSEEGKGTCVSMAFPG